MKPPVIAQLGLGSGIPKTIVPLTGNTTEVLLVQAQAALDAGADCVEWRVDFFEQVRNEAEVLNCLNALHNMLGATPLLATLRSEAQGGHCKLNPATRRALQHTLIASGKPGLIDVELVGEPACETEALVSFAHESGLAIVVSDHNFAHTPSFDVLYATLQDEYACGADICKIAVMANQDGDELQLMAATHQFMQDHPQALVIAIAMGQRGVITRLAGEFFGSCMTFCTAGAASAPGQVDIATARRIMRQLHEEGFEGGADNFSLRAGA